MQIFGSVSDTNRIITSGFEPEFGDSNRVNGQYIFPLPYSVGIEIGSASYMTPQNAGSIPGQAAAEFLIRFPMYDHVLYNYFLEPSDMTWISPNVGTPQPTTATVTPAGPPWAAFSPGPIPRTQLGSLSGVVPNAVAMLPVDSVNSTYGVLVTDVIDITALNPANPGTDEVMVWWAIARASTSEDVVEGYGATSGLNTPAVRRLERIDPETSGIYVYASNDNGASWYRVEYLEPIDLANAGTDIRFAFLNTTSDKVFLLGWVALIPDLNP